MCVCAHRVIQGSCEIACGYVWACFLVERVVLGNSVTRCDMERVQSLLPSFELQQEAGHVAQSWVG